VKHSRFGVRIEILNLPDHLNPKKMIRNYFKIAFRSLSQSKVHSLINISGLSLGIACCILIALFVRDEFTFDRFHSKADRIFRVYAIEDWGENQRFIDTSTPFPMGPALKNNFPEIEHEVRINNISPQVRVGDEVFAETVTIAGTAFLDVFDFELTRGNRADILNSQSHVLLSEDIARKFFGNNDPLNQIISIQLGESLESFTVKGVVRNAPANSSIQFGILISDLNYPRLYNERVLNSSWFNITPETYVLLAEGVEAKALEAKFPPLFKSILGENYEKSKYFVGLQPLTSIHLDTSLPPALAPVSNPKYSYILSAIAILILFVACINFVSLSIGRSLKRAKEVGIRKVAGAQRQQLVIQFVGEAVVVTLIALVVGLIISVLCLPLFNDLAGKNLQIPADGFMITMMLALTVIIGLIAGSYPAFIISGFKPIAILKGGLQYGSSKQQLRKMLVGVQLVLSIFLISSTLLMRKQLNYLQEKDLGFNRDQLAVVQLRVSGKGKLAERVAEGFGKAELFKQELSKMSSIVNVCASSHDFANGSWTNIGYTDDNGVYRTFNLNIIDELYIPSMKMELTAGRNFSASNTVDSRRSIIVNEAFAREYGWPDAIGKRIPGKNFNDHEIIGVVKDFHYASLYTKVEPLIMVMDAKIPLSGMENININNTPVPKLLVRLKHGEITTALDQLKGVWDKLAGGEEFNYSFVDQALAAQYRNDQNLGKIVSIATLLAVLIASLGLYGLASLAMQNRVKEISIRKVLGATERSLLMLLSKDYVYMILVAMVVAIPVTYYLMNDWLASFEYRVTIGIEIFLFAGGVSLLIAMLTISYQAIKTAWTQPASTLKHE
jgi:putative ABC transport system permease protein